MMYLFQSDIHQADFTEVGWDSWV